MVSDLDSVGISEDTPNRNLRSIEEARIELQEAMDKLRFGDFNLDDTIAKVQRLFTDLRSSWNG